MNKSLLPCPSQVAGRWYRNKYLYLVLYLPIIVWTLWIHSMTRNRATTLYHSSHRAGPQMQMRVLLVPVPGTQIAYVLSVGVPGSVADFSSCPCTVRVVPTSDLGLCDCDPTAWFTVTYYSHGQRQPPVPIDSDSWDPTPGYR